MMARIIDEFIGEIFSIESTGRKSEADWEWRKSYIGFRGRIVICVDELKPEKRFLYNLLMYKSKELFNRNLYGNIIYNMLNMEEYLKFLNQSDPTVQKALEVLRTGDSFPKAPEQKPEEAHERTEETIA